jgi:hypothetical protein
MPQGSCVKTRPRGAHQQDGFRGLTECVPPFTSVSPLLHMVFCGSMRTIPTVIRAPYDVESAPPAEAA